jgi:hypothetical protein
MQTDYKYSSVVFLHMQSADSKVKLVDRLCHAHFDKTIIKNEWTPLLKDLISAVAVRTISRLTKSIARISLKSVPLDWRLVAATISLSPVKARTLAKSTVFSR